MPLPPPPDTPEWAAAYDRLAKLKEDEMVTTRRDYMDIAYIFNRARSRAKYGAQRELWRELVHQLTTHYAHSQRTFNPQKFAAACGELNNDEPMDELRNRMSMQEGAYQEPGAVYATNPAPMQAYPNANPNSIAIDVPDRPYPMTTQASPRRSRLPDEHTLRGWNRTTYPVNTEEARSRARSAIMQSAQESSGLSAQDFERLRALMSATLTPAAAQAEELQENLSDIAMDLGDPAEEQE